MRPPIAGLGLFGSTLRVVPDNFGVVGAFFIAAGIERDLAWVGQLDRSVVDQGTRPTRTPGALAFEPRAAGSGSGLLGSTKTPSPQAGQRRAW